ncbi:MAG: HD domain-containing protein [Acidimicrobiales bacterium]
MEGHEMMVLAEQIARFAHAGQVDKSGMPYIAHPQRVADTLKGDDLAQGVAWLHDVIEDTFVTKDDLLAAGIPSVVVTAVEALSTRPSETSDEYLARVRANPIAAKVKMADIADNSDPTRLALLPQNTADRLRTKYAHAVEALNRV